MSSRFSAPSAASSTGQPASRSTTPLLGESFPLLAPPFVINSIASNDPFPSSHLLRGSHHSIGQRTFTPSDPPALVRHRHPLPSHSLCPSIHSLGRFADSTVSLANAFPESHPLPFWHSSPLFLDSSVIAFRRESSSRSPAPRTPFGRCASFGRPRPHFLILFSPSTVSTSLFLSVRFLVDDVTASVHTLPDLNLPPFPGKHSSSFTSPPQATISPFVSLSLTTFHTEQPYLHSLSCLVDVAIRWPTPSRSKTLPLLGESFPLPTPSPLIYPIASDDSFPFSHVLCRSYRLIGLQSFTSPDPRYPPALVRHRHPLSSHNLCSFIPSLRRFTDATFSLANALPNLWHSPPP